MKPIRIIVAGASGRMGQTIIKKIISNKSFKLIGATEGPGNKFLGSDVSKVIKSKKIGIYITDDIESCKDVGVLQNSLKDTTKLLMTYQHMLGKVLQEQIHANLTKMFEEESN